jgi:hypothetical protein
VRLLGETIDLRRARAGVASKEPSADGGSVMPIHYEDQHIVCDDDALTIKQYHFPFGSKRIAYDDITRIDEAPLGWFTGKLRIWGMGPAPYWFHLDWARPSKSYGIVLDHGSWLKSVLTPDDHAAAIALLRHKAKKAASAEV